MSDYRKANAVRIWQDETTGEELQCECSFLWEDVVKIESEHGSGLAWKSNKPKVYVTLGSVGGGFFVLGSFKRWSDRWDRFFKASDTAALIPFLN
ncbi:hypothetical protein LJ737_20740 [Hymenobacter sp. 15J16-1T3B]|uniref:hypothetical protein n=1 Tax=Hymenobacter sp. 15J16-1T3B TaxID=2886941 RepID=UPI001D0FE022|nr:hypothetical protein [Hymenobacter sp. 15J16-1T3B]MCC3159681.1 hypothetical protein [Hymenobacter sp. 15J16-1T3B]